MFITCILTATFHHNIIVSAFSKEFNNAINSAIYIGSGNILTVTAPFIGMNKAQVVKTGLELGVPYKMTWSCYEGGDRPCGKCGTCRDRAAAFLANGITEA